MTKRGRGERKKKVVSFLEKWNKIPWKIRRLAEYTQPSWTPLVDRSIRLHKLIRSYLAPKTILHPSQRCNNDDRFEKCTRFAFESFARPLPPFCPSLKRWNFQQFASREISLDNSEQNRDPPSPPPTFAGRNKCFGFALQLELTASPVYSGRRTASIFISFFRPRIRGRERDSVHLAIKFVE